MQLESLLLKLHPRLRYEAVDTGMLIARRWWLPLTLMCGVPAILTLLLVLATVDSIWLSWLLLWWMKPVYERLPLWYLGRAVFGGTPAVKTLLRAAPGVVGLQLLATLTWRRFSTTRSYDMPVVVLEGLRGVQRSQRLKVMQLNNSGRAAFWLTVWLVHVEMILQFSFLGLLYVLLPAASGTDFWTFTEDQALQFISYSLAIVLVMPFYVSGGFALYLNQRIHLEGWELELVFRRLASRLKASDSGAASDPAAGVSRLIPVIVLLAGTGGLLAPLPAQAEELAVPLIESPHVARAQIRQVLSGADFARTETRRIPRFLHDWDGADDPDSEGVLSDLLRWAESLATLFEWLAWLLVITFAGLLVFNYKGEFNRKLSRYRKSRRGADGGAGVVVDPAVTHAFGHERLSKDRLRTLWMAQRQREAMALLYQDGVQQLVQVCGNRPPDGATEAELLQLAKNGAPADFEQRFQRLLRSWQAIAYADRLPDDAEFQALLDDLTRGVSA